MENAEKEIEDLKKALWYIEDYRTLCRNKGCQHRQLGCAASVVLYTLTGHNIDDVVKGYEKNVAAAISGLLRVGIISEHTVYAVEDWEYRLDNATKTIRRRIHDIEHQLLEKKIDSTVQKLRWQLVDGEDFVSKPGCVRETEPEHYDPLNMIVAWGKVYSLIDEVCMKPNGALYSPCDNCDLSEYCVSQDGTEPLKNLCQLHQAKTNEYYREVGVARYSPRFGTVEVVDEYKETEIKLKRLEEEE